MADWYCSSAAYATYTAFQTAHAYVIGDIIVPTAPTLKNKWVFRCTTAGTSAGSEPTWSTKPNNNDTITSNTATFTNVTGQSTYFWTAASGDLPTLIGGGTGTTRLAAGDRMFISSDHSEAQTTATVVGPSGSTYTDNLYLCVNRGGSTPPVAADLTTGALISSNNTLTFPNFSPGYYYGITFSVTGSSDLQFNAALLGNKVSYLKNCQLYLNTATTTVRITGSSSSRMSSIILDNTTLRFGSTSQRVTMGSGIAFEMVWINTPSAIAGSTFPTILINENSGPFNFVARGVDLSAITGTLVSDVEIIYGGGKYLFDSCRIATGVTRYAGSTAVNTRDLVELVNCYDGTNILSECHQISGAVTTETTITLSGGAQDNVGVFSHKMVSNTNVDKFVNPLASFWLDVNYTTLTAPKTATVEIISSTTLLNDEIALYLEYEGTSGSSVTSFVDSFIATPLTAAGNVTTSSAAWNSLPATPVRQKLQVSFTPQQAGRVRGQVRLGKASTTVYINPQITIT